MVASSHLLHPLRRATVFRIYSSWITFIGVFKLDALRPLTCLFWTLSSISGCFVATQYVRLDSRWPNVDGCLFVLPLDSSMPISANILVRFVGRLARTFIGIQHYPFCLSSLSMLWCLGLGRLFALTHLSERGLASIVTYLIGAIRTVQHRTLAWQLLSV